MPDAIAGPGRRRAVEDELDLGLASSHDDEGVADVVLDAEAERQLVRMVRYAQRPDPINGEGPDRLPAVVVRDERGLLREVGVELPDDVEVRVWDSTAELRYLVLPERPAGTEGWSEEELPPWSRGTQ